MPYHGWAGYLRRAMPGLGGLSRASPVPALPYLIVVCRFCSLLVATLPLTEKTTAAAAAAAAGVVFYQYVATGINAAEHYKEQARAASGFSRIRWRARADSTADAGGMIFRVLQPGLDGCLRAVWFQCKKVVWFR